MFKDRLAKKLEEQKISRNAFAAKIGINQSSFSRIMTGDIKNPGVHTVAKIAKELNCSIDELIGRKVQGSQVKEDTQAPEKLKFDRKLVFNTADVVLNLLETKQNVKFEEFLSIAMEVYQYNLEKNSNVTDEHFTKWFIKHFFNSKDTNDSTSKNPKRRL